MQRDGHVRTVNPELHVSPDDIMDALLFAA